MTHPTALDDLCKTPFHEASAPLRARILSRLADSELFVTLTAEPADDRARIRILGDAPLRFALACDLQERLADFWGGPVAYAAMPGRVLADTLARDGKGLFVNPGSASEMLLGPDDLAWLVEALKVSPAPSQATVIPPTLFAPAPEIVAALLQPVSDRMAGLSGFASAVALTGARWEDGRKGHVLIIRGTAESQRDAIAKSFAELLSFLPPVEGGVDLGFSDGALPDAALVIEVPKPPKPALVASRDPAAPPRLR